MELEGPGLIQNSEEAMCVTTGAGCRRDSCPRTNPVSATRQITKVIIRPGMCISPDRFPICACKTWQHDRTTPQYDTRSHVTPCQSLTFYPPFSMPFAARREKRNRQPISTAAARPPTDLSIADVLRCDLADVPTIRPINHRWQIARNAQDRDC